jgi:nucleotide-binding universal stress UspA family protein
MGMKDRIRILVGVDGSNHSDRALLEAATIAKRFAGSVKVITVHGRGMEKKAKEILEHAKLYLENEVEYTTSSILGSNPARALRNVAEHENFDLIVVGSRGLGSKASIVLGSVSRRVVANADRNVLVVKT